MGTIKALAWYWYCAEWHTGQWSQEYRIMSRILERMRRIGISHPLDAAQRSEKAKAVHAQIEARMTA